MLGLVVTCTNDKKRNWKEWLPTFSFSI